MFSSCVSLEPHQGQRCGPRSSCTQRHRARPIVVWAARSRRRGASPVPRRRDLVGRPRVVEDDTDLRLPPQAPLPSPASAPLITASAGHPMKVGVKSISARAGPVDRYVLDHAEVDERDHPDLGIGDLLERSPHSQHAVSAVTIGYLRAPSGGRSSSLSSSSPARPRAGCARRARRPASEPELRLDRARRAPPHSSSSTPSA